MTLSEKGIVRPGQPVIRDGRYVVNFRGGGVLNLASLCRSETRTPFTNKVMITLTHYFEST